MITQITQKAYLCHSKCLRTLRRQINVVARRFGADCCPTLLRKICDLCSAESCGFKSQEKPFQIVIVVENTLILMPHMWPTANFRP